MQVFIENEAGSYTKNLYDQHSLAHVGATRVSLPYPYPYGFVIGTVSGDGDCADCFVLTKSAVSSGDTLECTPVGLLEQVEDGQTDHKILAVPVGESHPLDDPTVADLTVFISGVFAHLPGKLIEIGRLLDRIAAEAYVAACRREPRFGPC